MSMNLEIGATIPDAQLPDDDRSVRLSARVTRP